VKRYLVYYVGNDSHDHKEVVWAADSKKAVAKIEEKGGEMVKVVRQLMSPLALAGIYLAILVVVVFALLQKS